MLAGIETMITGKATSCIGRPIRLYKTRDEKKRLADRLQALGQGRQAEADKLQKRIAEAKKGAR